MAVLKCRRCQAETTQINSLFLDVYMELAVIKRKEAKIKLNECRRDFIVAFNIARISFGLNGSALC